MMFQFCSNSRICFTIIFHSQELCSNSVPNLFQVQEFCSNDVSILFQLQDLFYNSVPFPGVMFQFCSISMISSAILFSFAYEPVGLYTGRLARIRADRLIYGTENPEMDRNGTEYEGSLDNKQIP